MESSKIGLRKWAIAIYAFLTNLKGVSSMKLHRDLGIRQSSAWHMLQRIREAFDEGDLKFCGPMAYVVEKMDNKRLRYRDLIA